MTSMMSSLLSAAANSGAASGVALFLGAPVCFGYAASTATWLPCALRRRDGFRRPCVVSGVRAASIVTAFVALAALVTGLVAMKMAWISGSCHPTFPTTLGVLDIGSWVQQRRSPEKQYDVECVPQPTQNETLASVVELHGWLQCLVLSAQGLSGYGAKAMERTVAEEFNVAWASQVIRAVRALDDSSHATTSRLDEIRFTGKHTPEQTLAAVHDFASFEGPFKLAFTAMRTGIAALGPIAASGAWGAEEDLADMAELRSTLRVRLIAAMNAARGITAALPSDSASFQTAAGCVPNSNLLAGLESMAIEEAEEHEEPHVMFQLGVYLSSVCTTKVQVPFFGRSCEAKYGWTPGVGGWSVPPIIAQAESLLANAERLTLDTDDRQARARVRVNRIAQHAWMLARLHHDSAAEYRYRMASQISASYKFGYEAAASLSRLARLFFHRSRREEALATAIEALRHKSDDPTALFLRASMRATLGKLQTDVEAREVAAELRALEGRLPDPTIERKRAEQYAAMAEWEAVADSGPIACLGFGDAARTVLCLLLKLALPA